MTMCKEADFASNENTRFVSASEGDCLIDNAVTLTRGMLTEAIALGSEPVAHRQSFDSGWADRELLAVCR